MIIKKRTGTSDRKTNPLIGLLLFVISLILILITAPFGLIYGFFHTLFKNGIQGVGEYLYKIAASVDQLGNVLMQHLLNLLWVKPGGYKFGNRDETISSVLGKNKVLGRLTYLGKGIDSFLDFLDPNHSLNSIDYYIQPKKNVIDKLAWIQIQHGRILCVRSHGKDLYYIPGGKRETGESDAEALAREIKEELEVTIDTSTLGYASHFEAQAHGKTEGIKVRLTCYRAKAEGNPKAASEIANVAWLAYEDRAMVSEVAQLVFDYLHHRKEI